MRHVFYPLLAFLALAATEVSAAVLSPEEALERVYRSSGSKRIQSSVSPRLVKTCFQGQSPCLYLFSLPESTLIVSADSSSPALLGYLDNPLSDGDVIPDGMEVWLTQYSSSPYSTQEEKSTSLVSEIGAEEDMEPIAPLLTTRWGQGDPFNRTCPSLESGRAITGCVATAIAQVMKYHNWPKCGTGVKWYSWENIEYSMEYGLYEPAWEEMLDEYVYPNFTADQAIAVADLMKAAGIGVEMRYGVSNSGTFSSPITPLYEFFHYSGAMRKVSRQSYSDYDWEHLMHSQLKESGPVIYTATSNKGDGGHCFVCDGYDGDGYFHFNWGWSGHGDGFFLMTATDSAPALNNYVLQQSAVIGIRPYVEAEWYCPTLVSTGFDKHLIAEATDTRWWSPYRIPFLPCEIKYDTIALPGGLKFGMRFTDNSSFDIFFQSNTSKNNSKFISAISAPRPEELPDGVYTATIAAQAPDGSYYPIEFSDDALISLPVSKVDGEFFYNQVKGSQTSVRQPHSAPSTEWFDLSGASLGADRPEAPGLYIRTDTAPDGSRRSTKVAVR